MADIYVHHRVSVAPRQWRAVADALCAGGAARLADAGGALYGVWRSQIGRPRDELTVVTNWPGGDGAKAADCLLDGVPDIVGCQSETMTPTLRPDLAMWERSKIPQGEKETQVRRQLSRRYDLCDWTCVYTTTLLTAGDHDDSVRWT